MPTDTALVTLQRPLVQGIFTSGVFVTANKTATTGVGQFTLRNAEPTPSASTGLAYFGGGTPGLPFGNSVMLGFYGSPDTSPPDPPPPKTARARVWGISKAGADDFGGTYLGELILRMGNTSPGSGTFLNVLNKFVCDIKVVAPDRSLTPPGMRVLGHDVNLGCAYVLLDAMGFHGIALQIRIDDPSQIVNLGYVYRIL